MKRLRAHSVLLATLSVLFGVHAFRVLLPTLIWYAGQFMNAQQQRNAGYISLLFIPGAILLTGIYVWWGRR